MVTDYRVVFLKPKEAALISVEMDEEPGPDEVFGRNLYSLISSGSERGGFTSDYDPSVYPMQTGYSSIAQVIRVGSNVTRLKPGDLFYHNEFHTLYVKTAAANTLSLPSGSIPHKALFGRFAAVSMTSIFHSKAKPVDNILVTGLGMVGLMGAQVLQAFGFRVYGIDPSQDRRQIALEAGLLHVAASADEWPALKSDCAALFECSGNENAMRAAIPYLRKGGEIFQVGVPWKKSSDWDAHTLLHELFYGFLTLQGGWEWSIPRQNDDFHSHSNASHILTAMEMISNGQINIPESMYEFRSPAESAAVYQEIIQPRLKPTSVIFDWKNFDGN